MFSTSVVTFTRYEVAVELLLVLISAASVHPYTVEPPPETAIRWKGCALPLATAVTLALPGLQLDALVAVALT